MKSIFQRSGTYVRTRDTLSWFLAIAGFVVVAMLSESVKLHREVGPQGGHHGDVAGGLSLLVFLLLMTPFILAFAGIGALLGRSTMPFIGAILGLIASIPMLLVLGIVGSLLLYISPFLAIPFPFVGGIALVVMGFLRKTKKTTKTCSDAS